MLLSKTVSVKEQVIYDSSVQFSPSVVSDSLRPHGLQHTRPPCPLPTPGVYSNSCPLSRWCHPTISSIIPFFSCLQSCTASGSFQMTQLFASGGQNIGVSASTSVLPMNTVVPTKCGRKRLEKQARALSTVLQFRSRSRGIKQLATYSSKARFS